MTATEIVMQCMQDTVAASSHTVSVEAAKVEFERIAALAIARIELLTMEGA